VQKYLFISFFHIKLEKSASFWRFTPGYPLKSYVARYVPRMNYIIKKKKKREKKIIRNRRCV